VSSLQRRAEYFAALGDPVRLAIVDELVTSDRTPGELMAMTGLSSPLLTHHLDILDAAGVVVRTVSHHDRRKRFVRLVPAARPMHEPVRVPRGAVLFVCTANSARSQLAAALWTELTGGAADSAGTEPAERVHPMAVRAADAFGVDIADNRPRVIRRGELRRATVITVCDQAHDEIAVSSHRWHWSIPDPAADGTRRAFDAVVGELRTRIAPFVDGLDKH
jgi:protein-tyrosine-phosphatase/DNA-binding HxlR family transcriptional regulator